MGRTNSWCHLGRLASAGVHCERNPAKRMVVCPLLSRMRCVKHYRNPIIQPITRQYSLTAFFHFMLMNPVFPDAQPYDTWIIIVIAVIVVWVNRKEMFTKEGAFTRVIPLIEK